jgi:hypothetical protein
MIRNNPSKPLWWGKTVQITVRKPTKSTLAGKNVRGQHDIPRENHFCGEFLHEFESKTVIVGTKLRAFLKQS